MEIVETEHIFDLIIIGAGPHGLAVASRLREPRPSALYTDAESSRLSFLRRFSKARTSSDRSLRALKVLVVDKAGDEWLAHWDRQFRALDIKHLRSPMFFHPDPSDLDALLAFSHGKGCDCDDVEITGVIGKERSKHKTRKARQKRCQTIATDFNEREREDYFNPSARTFKEFCCRIVDKYHLRGIVRQAEVRDIEYARIHEKHVGIRPPHFSLCLAGQDQKVHARALVLAPGVGGWPNLLPELSSYPNGESWCHSSQISTDAFPPPRNANQVVKTMVVVGGGLTSAQVVDLALKKGVAKVYLVMRSHMKIKHFDLDLDWLGKIGNIKKMQFFQSDFKDRAKTVLQARNGGSIPPTYAKLLAAHENTGRLQILPQSTMTKASWDLHTSQWTIDLNCKTRGPEAQKVISLHDIDYVVCATGGRPSFAELPCMQHLNEDLQIETSCGLPHLTEDLQLQSKVPLFVASGYAALQLGPGAFNLSGSREAAERIANRLEELFIDDRDIAKTTTSLDMLAGNECNYFSILSAA